MKTSRNFILALIILVLALGLYGCTLGAPKNQVTILAGSELKDIEPLLPQIRKETGIDIKFTYIGTLDGAERIMTGADYDMAWFSHAKYLNLMQGSKDRILAQDKIMLSPVVFGVKQSLARSWGWENNPDLTWKDLVSKANSGEFRFAMTNPSASNSGFSALMGVASALANTGEALTAEDVKVVEPQLAEFFKGLDLTSGSSGWLADRYVIEQDSLDGLVNYESVLLGLNQGGQLKEKLTLIYPREGIVTADYPLMLLNADKRDAYAKLVACLTSDSVQQWLMDNALRRPIKPSIQLSNKFPSQILVELPFPNKIEVVNDLLLSYLNKQVRPSTTIYVLDLSGSMSGNRLDDLKTALHNLAGADSSVTGQFARFRDREQLIFLPFSAYPMDPVEFTIDASSPDNLRNLDDYIDSLNTYSNTAIYDSLIEAYRQIAVIKEQNPDRLYSVVLMSDGENNTGAELQDFTRFIQNETSVKGIRTWTVLFGNANKREMTAIAEATQGKMFDASKESLAFIFKEIRGYQ